jgi:hypothetical protein
MSTVSRVEDDPILALVTRLARPHPSGGDVIERAAILAEGADFHAVIAWIISHDGVPESAVVSASTSGLHGGTRSAPSRPPLRFVLPAGTLR